MSLGVPAPSNMKSASATIEPFKEHFRRIPLPLLEEVHASLRNMLEAGAI